MHYTVFLDTNIYENASFSFSNGVFTRLRELGKAGTVRLQTNSMVESEVLLHIEAQVRDAVTNLKGAAAQRSLAAFRKLTPYEALLSIPEAECWIEALKNEYRALLAECSCEMIPLNGIDVVGIVEDYRSKRYPFQSRKPNEFKDAMIIRSILKAVEEVKADEYYLVASEDKGFRKAIKAKCRADYIQVFPNLPALLEFIMERESLVSRIKAHIEQSEEAVHRIQSAVEEAVRSADIDITTVTDYIEEIDLESVENIQCTASIIALYGTVVIAAIRGKCQVCVTYRYVDEEQSCYDREDQCYLWTTTIERQDTAMVEVNLTASFDVSNSVLRGKEGAITFLEYIDLPDAIQISEKCLISSKVLSVNGPFDEDEGE